MPRPLTMFSRVCSHSLTSNCPHILLLSEVIIKKGQAYFQNNSDRRLEVHLMVWIKFLPKPPSPWSWHLTPDCKGKTAIQNA